MLPALAVQTPRSSSSGEASDERVARPAQLERADRLEVLELQIELGRGALDLDADERRADDGSCESVPSSRDLGERDHSSISVPRPSSSARR